MSSAPVKSLIDEQIDDIERSLGIIAFGLPFNEVLNLPRETLVAELPQRLAPTMQGGHIEVRVRQ